MKYKESARSPQYGKIFAYDINGKIVDEVNVLKVIVEHEGSEYSIKQLLEKIIVLETKEIQQEITNINQKKQIDKHEKQIKLLTDALREINNRLSLIESKNSVL